MVSFDPYLTWLGIPAHEQPPNYYRLLGVILFESNPEVIEQAADRQSLKVGAYHSGPQGEACQQLLSEIAMARFCLLEPHQKAAYDGHLQEGLAQRGERMVVAPPPPAPLTGPRQFGSPPQQFGQPPQQPGPLPFSPQRSQFGPPAGMGPVQLGYGMPVPMTMPGPPPPMAPQMHGFVGMQAPAAMPIAPQPATQMPPAMMPPGMMPPPTGFTPAMPQPSAPMGMPAATGFAPAMPQPTAPAAMPAAASFPAQGTPANSARPAVGPAAPPVLPPVAPKRPIDELESLTSQPVRRRFLKKKKTTDYSREIILGGVVTVAGVLLFIAYAALANRDDSKRGYDAIEPEKPLESVRAAMDSARKKFFEDLLKKDKEREIIKEKEKKAAAEQGRQTMPNRTSADSAGAALPKAYGFGPPRRAMDSPASGGSVGSGRPPRGGETSRDPNGDNDPVMEKLSPP